ncbi:hypothetical protein Tco_1418684 [Tanacetum coccineum]
MADDRPMAEQLTAPTGGFESAIVVPIINAQNFELKSSLINLVQNRIFRGRNEMNEMKNMMKALVPTPAPIKAVEERKPSRPKEKVLPEHQDIQPPVIKKSHDPVKPVSSPISPELSSAQVNNSPSSKEPSKKTRLPYPSRGRA